jgi:hypothetical protein
MFSRLSKKWRIMTQPHISRAETFILYSVERVLESGQTKR